MKVDVATFGSATKDVFLRADSEIIENGDFRTGEGLCFPLGSKVPAEEVFFTTGGGGTNTAVSFARQGLKVAYVGKIGQDGAGRDILKVLNEFGILTDFVIQTTEARTNYSIVLDAQNEDRTILVYRGASGKLKKEEVPDDLQADWYYLAPFPQSALEVYFYLLKRAQQEDVCLAANPSESQLKNEKFTEKINLLDLLIVNQEEASILTGIDYTKEEEIFRKIDEMYEGVFIMTKGPEGLVVSDDEKLYEVHSTPDEKVVDRTGAGDSFASGFLSGYINTGKIKEAIQLGIGNATNCLKERGAKNGLLKEEQNFKRVQIYETKKPS